MSVDKTLQDPQSTHCTEKGPHLLQLGAKEALRRALTLAENVPGHSQPAKNRETHISPRPYLSNVEKSINISVLTTHRIKLRH